MTASGPGSRRNSLLALDTSPPRGGFQETAAAGALRDVVSGWQSPALWVHGADGCGKTTTIAQILAEGGEFTAVKRVACHPGLRLEEALYHVGMFLRQAGIVDLSEVLDQRTNRDSKLAVLLDVVAAHPVVVWWDDVEYLQAGDGETNDDGATTLLARSARLPSPTRGRMLFSSALGPPESVQVTDVELPDLEIDEARRLWDALTPEDCVTRLEELPESESRRPLALELLSTIGAGDRPLGGELRAASDSPGLPEACDSVLRRLGPDSMALLEVIASFGRPLSRQALRDLSAGDGAELTGEEGALDPRLLELESYGLARLDEPRHGDRPYCTLHPAVQAHVASRCRERHERRWLALLGAVGKYYLQLAMRSGEIWHFYLARRYHFEAGLVREACQLNRTFLETLLSCGYFHVASEVLSQTVETTSGLARSVALGNLAMIYKNHGKYAEALKLYERSRRELAGPDDRANLARVLHQIGNTRYLQREYDRALDSYRESQALSGELGDRSIQTATRVQIANVLWALDRREEAFRGYEDVLETLESGRNGRLVAAVKLQLGFAHLQSKRYVEAESCYAEAEDSARGTNDRRGVFKAQRARALLARERRDYEASRGHYEQAIDTAQQLGDLIEVASCHVLLGDLEKDRTRFGKSLGHYLEAGQVLTDVEESRILSARDLEPLRQAISERQGELSRHAGEETYKRLLAEYEPGAGG
ncbi:MAG: tetratricopeptide repeat protein [Planctomycetota bacterium]|nr:tetratricopeptide repeat protein [Planctomycetota bacterium]